MKTIKHRDDDIIIETRFLDNTKMDELAVFFTRVLDNDFELRTVVHSMAKVDNDYDSIFWTSIDMWQFVNNMFLFDKQHMAVVNMHNGLTKEVASEVRLFIYDVMTHYNYFDEEIDYPCYYETYFRDYMANYLIQHGFRQDASIRPRFDYSKFNTLVRNKLLRDIYRDDIPSYARTYSIASLVANWKDLYTRDGVKKSV